MLDAKGSNGSAASAAHGHFRDGSPVFFLYIRVPASQCFARFTIGTRNKARPGPKLFSARYPLLSDRLGGGPQH